MILQRFKLLAAALALSALTGPALAQSFATYDENGEWADAGEAGLFDL